MQSTISDLLHSVAVASNEASTPEEAITNCLTEVCKYTGWELGQAFSFSPERPQQLLASRGWFAADYEKYKPFREATETTLIVWGADIPGRVLAKGAYERVSSLEDLGKISRHLIAQNLGLRSGIGFPVLVGKEVGAVLEFFSSREMDNPEFYEVIQFLTPQLARVIERARSERELILAREVAIEASVAKSDFLAQMSHEIRTPINAVLGMSHLLLSTPLNADQREYSDLIRESAQSLLSIVNDVLDISKIEAGKLDIQISDFQLDALLKDTTSMLSYSARNKDLEFATHIDPEVPLLLRGDAGRLRQVLVNLIGNAIKFTDSGSVHVRSKLQSQSDTRVNLLFEVEDTGVGIPVHVHSEIFETFSQVNQSSNRKYSGPGLGLSISRRLVEMMGGEIGFFSPDEGKGSVFWLTVELQKSARSIISHSPILTEKSSASILIVEDNEINQLVTLYILRQKGFQVLAVDSGMEALRVLNERNFDLIIMDCQMPGLDGYETTRCIRENEKNTGKKSLPIIALTASAITGDREKCLAAGMNDYLSKPADPEVLFNRIDYWLHMSRPTSPQHLVSLEELLPELIQLFKTQSPLKLKEMEMAIQRRDSKKLQSEAHSLKSSSGNLGFRNMNVLCSKLEKQAVEGDFDNAATALKGLETAYNQACLNFDISKPTTLW
jgi:signal transduction histidine kinase/CheY-like chemotaxis protein